MTATINGDQNGTVGLINTMTEQATTSGTAINFTGIPAGVKRITVMLSGVSTNGSSLIQIQVGAGSITTSGYSSIASYIQNAGASGVSGYSSGFVMPFGNAANSIIGAVVLTQIVASSNKWVISGNLSVESATSTAFLNGVVNLSGALDRLRLTTVNGTDTFDAGSVNILYE